MPLNNFTLEKTAKTPRVDLSQSSGELSFSGKSIPENAAKVYEPVLNWISEYALKAKPITNLRLNIEYFNTASMMWLSRNTGCPQKNKRSGIHSVYSSLYAPGRI